jgi:hypothetical protein
MTTRRELLIGGAALAASAAARKAGAATTGSSPADAGTDRQRLRQSLSGACSSTRPGMPFHS